MFGIKLTRKNATTLVIEVDLASKDARPSSSGKSVVVATSEGNQDIPGPGGFRLGLNVYRRKEVK